MDVYEKYFFDVNGYLVVKDVLTPEEVATCNEALDRQADRIKERSEDNSLSRGSTALAGQQGRGDIGGMLTWPEPDCVPFRNLLAHQRVVPYLIEILGDGFRLDHLYGIQMRKGTEGHVLHGGGAQLSPIHFYRHHNGAIQCGLSVFSFLLTDQGPDDGGFSCIPGSHKANFHCPPEVLRLEKDLGMIVQPAAKAGSLIIFTEALTHGTKPWQADHQRRAILYKYAPGELSYASRYRPPGVDDVIDEFTPAQQAILQPPYRPNRPKIGELVANGGKPG
jgi:ectoine hydroxylase-related dioxygenase (phytanoyl-CoA dioxygenase family)